MGQRNPVNVGATPQRYIIPFAEYMERRGINDALPAAEKMEKLQTLFHALAACTHAISDNLQPGELQRRLQDTKIRATAEHMVDLLGENEHAVDLLRDCVAEMHRCPLSKVNGTSQVFSECNRIYVEEAQRLETGKRELTGLLHPETVTVPANDTGKGDTGWTPPVMACLLVQLTSFFLVFEDVIAA